MVYEFAARSAHNSGGWLGFGLHGGANRLFRHLDVKRSKNRQECNLMWSWFLNLWFSSMAKLTARDKRSILKSSLRAQTTQQTLKEPPMTSGREKSSTVKTSSKPTVFQSSSTRKKSKSLTKRGRGRPKGSRNKNK